MKNLIVVLSLLLTANVSMALGAGAPSADGTGYQCAFYDRGTEEHRPHATRKNCKKKHSKCEKRCYSYKYTCTAVGYVRPNNDRNQPRVERSFVASGKNKDNVYNKAYRKCDTSRARRCDVVGCSNESRRSN